MRIYKTREQFTKIQNNELSPPLYGSICTITDESEHPSYLYNGTTWDAFVTSNVDPVTGKIGFLIDGVWYAVEDAPVAAADYHALISARSVDKGDATIINKVGPTAANDAVMGHIKGGLYDYDHVGTLGTRTLYHSGFVVGDAGESLASMLAALNSRAPAYARSTLTAQI